MFMFSLLNSFTLKRFFSLNSQGFNNPLRELDKIIEKGSKKLEKGGKEAADKEKNQEQGTGKNVYSTILLLTNNDIIAKQKIYSLASFLDFTLGSSPSKPPAPRGAREMPQQSELREQSEKPQLSPEDLNARDEVSEPVGGNVLGKCG